MKKIPFLLLCSLFIITTQSIAQKKSSKSDKAQLGIGAEVLLPVSDLSKTSSFGAGGSADFAIPLFEDGAITVGAGYLNFFGKTNNGIKYNNSHIIPIKAGLRFGLGSDFYAEPQLGYTKYSESGAFTYAAKVGIRTSNNLDYSIRYESSSKSTQIGTVKITSNTSFIGLRIAYYFAL